jgi:hypothetical protein
MSLRPIFNLTHFAIRERGVYDHGETFSKQAVIIC